jgi:hypothetical protein
VLAVAVSTMGAASEIVLGVMVVLAVDVLLALPAAAEVGVMVVSASPK